MTVENISIGALKTEKKKKTTSTNLMSTPIFLAIFIQTTFALLSFQTTTNKSHETVVTMCLNLLVTTDSATVHDVNFDPDSDVTSWTYVRLFDPCTSVVMDCTKQQSA